jgi:ADP-ribosylglycohydrolase
MNRAEKIIGCILGGAIGDCLGGPYEGGTTPITIDYQHEWKLSDDTQMTLATCEAISRRGGVDPATIASVFVTWFKKSRITGFGAATYKALSELSRGAHWALVGRKGEMAAGNGAAMRIAPLAFWLDPEDSKARVAIRDVCRITHHNEEAYVGALAVALAIRFCFDGTWNGQSKIIQPIADKIPDSCIRDRLIALSEIDDSTPLADVAERFGCSGHVVESVPFALFAAQRGKLLGFEALIGDVVSCGGDTDTTASMVGQIMGTLAGQSGIPNGMIARLPELKMIVSISREFAQMACK